MTYENVNGGMGVYDKTSGITSLIGIVLLIWIFIAIIVLISSCWGFLVPSSFIPIPLFGFIKIT